MITGIILASGFSSRMKEDKLLINIDGVAMVERVIKACKLSCLDDIILIYRKEEVKRIGEKYGLKTFYNPNAHLGQSEALKIGVREAKSADAYMFLLGDQPFITSKLIDKLIDEYNKTKATIVVPNYNGENGPPTIFSSTYRCELLALQGDKGGRDIIKKNIHSVQRVNIEDVKAGMDIDTIEDIYKLTIFR